MKKFLKKIIPFTCICAFLFGSLHPSTVFANEAEQQSVTEMLTYFKEHGNLAETDILRLLADMESNGCENATVWRDIMQTLLEVNREDAIGTQIPAGLPEDNSLAIVILGYALNDNGTMKSELVGRLETGLALANEYPEAYVVVTGGGTAKNAPEITEGGAMAEWLLEKGLKKERLIVEDRAANTILNAENTYNILKNDYPQVKSISIVSSDYHMPRASALFYTKFRLCAAEQGSEPLILCAGCGYKSGHNGYEAIDLQANNVASIAGISLKDKAAGPLSKLIGIAAVRRQDGSFVITAHYENGFYREVLHGIYTAPASGGTRISYSENGVNVGGTLANDSEIGHFYSSSYLSRIRAVSRNDRSAELRKSVEITLMHAASTLNTVSDSTLDISYVMLCNTVAVVIIFLFILVKAGVFHRAPAAKKIRKK